DLGDRVLGDVEARGIDAPFAQLLDEEAEGAAGVEHGHRMEVADEPVGDAGEELEPALVALVRSAAAPVVRVVGGAVLGRLRLLGLGAIRGGLLRHPRRSLVVGSSRRTTLPRSQWTGSPAIPR